MIVFAKKIFNTTTIWLVLIASLLVSCDVFFKQKSPINYVLPRPKKTILDKKLNEISGLYFLQETGGFLAIADNKQKIYHLTIDGKESEYWPEDFGDEEDYEDVLKIDSTIYVLISNGTLVGVKRTDTALISTKYPFWSTEKNDFETIYYDDSTRSIVMICKSCADERGKNLRTAYRFDIETKQFDTAVYYRIAQKAVADKLKDGKIELNPSAAAIHPIEKRLYILSSAGHLLIVTNMVGVVQQVFRLNPTFYPQAEGITFTPNGDLYISNEAKLGKPTLLRIPYKRTK